jgi:hypothetical protein
MKTTKQKSTKKPALQQGAVKRSAVRKCYWIGIIGETEHKKLPFGADSPMRKAVEVAFKEVTGHDEEILYSGWSADAKAVERILKVWQ